MPLSAEFTVEGSSSVTAHQVAFGATVDLALLSFDDVSTIAWSIAGTSHSSMTTPTITSAGSPTGATASFAMPADPGDNQGRSVLVKCLVTDSRGQTATAYRVVGAVNGAGRVPFATGEENYRNATHGWTDDINAALALNDISLPLDIAHGDTLVRGRNFADTADVGLFAWGTVDNDEILIGNANHVAFVTVLMKSTAEFGIYADGAARFVVSVAGAVQAESATAPTVNAGQGGWWVENTAPSRPMFKDDVGNSFPLGPYEAENALTGAANTLSLAAVGKRTTVSHGSATQLTVPPNSGVAFPVGIILNIVQIGAGTVEIVQGSGVTVHPQPGSTLFLAGQWASVQLWQQSADVWVLTGGLA